MAAALPELDSIDKNSIVDDEGVTFRDFRRTLRPRFARAWFDIALGYVLIVATAIAVVALDRVSLRLLPLSAVGGALVIGYAIAYIQLFFHEAAHYNLAKSRRANDLLANAFIGLMVGQNIKAYRVVHFDHHRLLGTPGDTERSYFDALDARFIVEALTGIKLLKVLIRRSRHVEGKARPAASEKPPGAKGMLLAGLVFNLSIVTLAVLGGAPSLALAWCGGMVLVHPFFNAVRQVLEHRSFEARRSVDYSTEPHGPVTRMFGDGPISSTLGGAGFNRHLLHHWEPQISYTCFRELEVYLSKTQAGDVISRSKTTYGIAFRRLLEQR